MAFTQITVTGQRQLPDGTAATGAVTLTPSAAMRNGTAAAETSVQGRVHGQITAGAISVSVAATTDPGTTPTGVTYLVEEWFTGVSAVRRYHLAVPHDSPSGVLDLDTAEIIEAYPDAIVQIGPPGPTGPAGPAGPEGSRSPTVALSLILGGG